MNYKGFDKDLKCRDFQYEIGKEYEMDGPIVACRRGFHACAAPLEVFDYYSPVDSRYCEVEQSGQLDTDNGSKIASKKIKIGAEIGIKGLVDAHIEFIREKTEKLSDDAKIGSSGDDAKIGSSGDDAKIGSSGRYAKIGSSGDDAFISCEADHAVVCCAGKRAKVKAPAGTWITLSEYGEWNGEGYPCVCVKSAQIDGETLKADTWYTLENGEFVEVIS